MLPFLTPRERDALSRLTARDCVWAPLPGPQFEAYYSQADELFYGGAAGGGKTDLLLGLALTAHRRSIIFRREYPQLRAIIERGNEIVGPRGTFNGQDHLWRLRRGGSIELGAVQYDGDVDKYQGRPHDLVAFDELPNFTEGQYRFLNGWKRTEVVGQRVRTACTGNPPASAEGRWVIAYWRPWLDPTHPRPAKPGELRWFAAVDGEDVERDGPEPFEHEDEIITPRSRTFIPSRVEDNPYYMRTGYRAQLQALPEPLRSQMLYGDFSAGIEDNPWQVIPTAWVNEAMGRWQEKPPGPLTCLGVDVARGGKDSTVLAARHKEWFAPLAVFPGAETPNGPAVAAQVVQALAGSQAPVHVDVIGVGASVYDVLTGKVSAKAINFAERSHGMDRSGQLAFVNLRAEGYWRLREALDPASGAGLCLPVDTQLLADLCAPRWEMRVGGIQIEDKEAIIKRLGRSPDRGDAVALTMVSGLSPADLIAF